ncbi:MAG: hypothetical protein JSW64_07000 [Candidatus Zixiibacteriota bacterium]|nr:MAG: hypothetical protein JSW64_07000 [candidate division Zixibacteria bacterium]
MLIGYHKNNDGRYGEHYLGARKKIDVLCELIVSGRLSRKEALKIYREIENNFAELDPDNAQLFNMIYETRVNRLCDQFCRK